MPPRNPSQVWDSSSNEATPLAFALARVLGAISRSACTSDRDP